MAVVYVNGELLPESDAKISTFDHGLVVGDGVFETVLLRAGRPFALRRHLERLNRSLAGLSMGPANLEEITTAVNRVVDECEYADGRIRITVTAGNGPLGSGRYAGDQSIVVACAPATEPHATAIVQTVPWPRNERGALVGLKTISYAENAVALAFAAARGADEAIFANLLGNLCEGSGSNIFVVTNGELITPPLNAGCLAGITRGLILEHCGGIERDLPIQSFCGDQVEEAFVCSAIRGVQPVEAIDGVPLRQAPGPITKEIANRYEALRDADPEP